MAGNYYSPSGMTVADAEYEKRISDKLKEFGPEGASAAVAVGLTQAAKKFGIDTDQVRASAEMSSVNAVNRMRGVLPGVGGYGSTPETDAQNLGIANAMDRADRFNGGGVQPQAPAQVQPAGIDIAAVNERRNQILNGIDPDRPAIYVNPKRQAELNHELGTLTNIAHEHALETAHTTALNLAKQNDIDSANDFTAFAQKLAGMKTKRGTPEHLNELATITADHSNGAQTPAGLKLLSTYASGHHESASLKDRIAEYVAATGEQPNSIETTATGAVNLRGKSGSAAAVSESALRDLAKMNATKSSQQVYLDKEVDPKKKVLLQKNIDALDASIGAWHATYNPLAKPAATTQSVAQMQPTATTATGTAAPTPDDIRAQYKAGKLTKDQATEMLKKGHGFE